MPESGWNQLNDNSNQISLNIMLNRNLYKRFTLSTWVHPPWKHSITCQNWSRICPMLLAVLVHYRMFISILKWSSCIYLSVHIYKIWTRIITWIHPGCQHAIMCQNQTIIRPIPIMFWYIMAKSIGIFQSNSLTHLIRSLSRLPNEPPASTPPHTQSSQSVPQCRTSVTLLH